jgi:hypothetical protein
MNYGTAPGTNVNLKDEAYIIEPVSYCHSLTSKCRLMPLGVNDELSDA